MSELFARYLTPLTYLLWVVIIIGAVDHFVVHFLPPDLANAYLYALWPLVAAVWFGHKYNARLKAQEARDKVRDGV